MAAGRRWRKSFLGIERRGGVERTQQNLDVEKNKRCTEGMHVCLRMFLLHSFNGEKAEGGDLKRPKKRRHRK